jgi:hypothetical protein
LQLTPVWFAILTARAEAGSLIFTVAVLEQLLASVTVTT